MVHRATQNDFDVVCDVTAKGFADDPVLTWMLRKGPDQAETVRLFIRTMARLIYFRTGESWVNDAGTGATMWLPPGASGDLSFREQIRSTPTMIRLAGLTGIPRLLRVQSFLDEKHPKEPHYYLFTIASLPEMRGQGIGSGLMEPMMQQFDQEQIPSYLENSKEANLSFYQRHGYEVVEEIRLLNEGPPMWLMWRKPRT